MKEYTKLNDDQWEEKETVSVDKIVVHSKEELLANIARDTALLDNMK